MAAGACVIWAPGCVGVYKLSSPVTGEEFAVKVIDRLQQGASAKHNFQREVEIFNRLRHPGVCRLRGVVVSEPDKIMLVTHSAASAAGWPQMSQDDARWVR